jgi:hypothetical protein
MRTKAGMDANRKGFWIAQDEIGRGDWIPLLYKRTAFP